MVALAGLAFVAYWGIVLFGYDTCVSIFFSIAPTLTTFFSAVSRTFGWSNMVFMTHATFKEGVSSATHTSKNTLVLS